MGKEEITFWLGVGIVAIVSVALFKLLAAGPVGKQVPALSKLGAFI